MENYVDPNSGAAPQPGGFAGAHAAEKGFAIPEQYEVENELSPAEYVAPGQSTEGAQTVTELAEASEKNNPPKEKTAEEKLRLEALTNPTKVLADLDENTSDEDVPEGEDEETASNNAAAEHEGILPGADADSEDGGNTESYDPSEYNVDEVNAYLEEYPDQRDAVLAAERAGKARKGILGDE